MEAAEGEVHDCEAAGGNVALFRPLTPRPFIPAVDRTIRQFPSADSKSDGAE